jgi:hypothetical protein
VQEKTQTDNTARIVGKVYEKLGGSRSLEGSERSDHIYLESTNIIFKRSYKKLLTINN